MLKRFVTAALAITVAACSSEKVSGPAVPMHGIFVLRSINGTALPASANLPGVQPIDIIADTIWLADDGFGSQKTVSSSAAASGPYVGNFAIQVSDKGDNKFDAEYPCPDNTFFSTTATCIAPPHHKGVLTSSGMTLNYSVMYRTPMVYERVGEITFTR